ncbi:hypothetical protein CF326_g6894 [Tilletia indica]|nr:hypothetical protein CF326_g6894 [Tilletia indica]
MQIRSAILALLALTLSVQADHHSQRSPSHHAHSQPRSLLNPRDAYNQLEGDNNQDGGPRHGPLRIPSGSRLRNFTVGDSGEQLITYWSKSLADSQARQAILMFHGRDRDGDDYWEVANDVLRAAVQDGFPGASRDTLIIAPQFLSTIRNSGQYGSNQIAFADVNAWQVGEKATHPRGTRVTSFSAIDNLINRLADKSRFPNLKRIVLVGHGGGGQLVTRYAVLSSIPPSSQVAIRFVVGDPSTNLYFTDDRPLRDSFDAQGSTKGTCPLYNTYRYGFTDLTKYNPTAGSLSPSAYFARFAQRDVVFTVGNNDKAANGDQTCMAHLMGGSARCTRTFMYWRYINQLAGTTSTAKLSGFPGRFSSKLPNWSNLTGGKLSAQLVIIPNASHDAEAVFHNNLGRGALFTVGKVPRGGSP